jgi:hypothetical protein
MSNSRVHLVISATVLFVGMGVLVVWFMTRWGTQERPRPRKILLRKGPPIEFLFDDEKGDELALPPVEPGDKDKVVRQIQVDGGHGWRLELRSDGTTRLGFGAADIWQIKPNTFDFAATLKELRAVARKEPFPEGGHYRVSFLPEGESDSIQGYTRDSKLIAGLFDKAAGALQDRDERFDELRKHQPPPTPLGPAGGGASGGT